MSNPVPPIPEGLHTLTPSLNLSNAREALRFYGQAFGAVERFCMNALDGSGKILHGEMQIGDSVIMFCDEAPDWGALSPLSVGGCPLSLNLYLEDCDVTHAQALAAGAQELRPPTTYPWGERSSMIRDPYGYRWAICTQVELVSPEEVQRRLKTWQG
ncbi:MAG: VOC family protein [Blastochloris sp.]|nr:VOC family protein [Blastochloris sp.]